MTIGRCDVVVAGLGAMGSAAACHLARRGVRVIGLDRFHPPHDRGSSHGESRIIREAYFEHPGYVPLVQRAYELWADLEARTGLPLLRTTGAIMIGPEDGELVQGALASAAAHRLPYERLTASDIRARFPVLHAPVELVGIYEPRAGVLSPERGIEAHLAEARQAGADLRFGEPMIEWRSRPDGVEVVSATGRYEAGALVTATGAWMPQMVRLLGLRVERVPMFWFRPARDASAFTPDRCPIYLWQYGPGPMLYGFPDLGAGVKVAHHFGGTPATAGEVVRDVGEDEVRKVREPLARLMPAASGEILRTAVCLYTNTRDGHFAIDWHPHEPRVLLVSPCSGHGFKFSSAIGEAVADLVTRKPPRHDLELFRIERLLSAREG